MLARVGSDPRIGALAVVAALALAALVHPFRPVVAAILLAGYVVARQAPRGPAASALAGALPVAAILAWGTLGQPVADQTGAQCADLLAPPALWRLAEAAVGLAVLGVLVVDRASRWSELGFNRASRRVTAAALAGLVVVAPIALLGGTVLGSDLLGGSFFGTFALDLSQPLALAPALIFAVSNALAEELSYRGALRAWLTPALGVVGANLGQAVVFGLAHSGADFVGPVAPVAASMILAGFAAGVIARRTSSLVLVIAIHAAADIPIYFYWACRVA